MGRGGVLVWAPQDAEVERRGTGPHSLLLSLDHKCSVFYAAPTKSKLLSTLCSADVCQCAEGENEAWVGLGDGWGGRPSWSHLIPDLREVPETATLTGARGAGQGWLPHEVCLLLSTSGVWSVVPAPCPPPPAPRPLPPVASILFGTSTLASLGCPLSPQAHPWPLCMASTSLPFPVPSQASRLRFSEKMAEPPSASLRPRSPESCISVGRRGGRAG